MYIEYITPQRVADPNFTKYDTKGGEYRPTWLIRTSDWQKVPGHEASNGYHTLSYCWEQSGEKFLKDDGREFGLIDKGYHEITRRKNGITNSSYATYDDILQQICEDFDIEYLWYDKICIDQTNKAEKYREIKQMHLIYSNACYTVALVPEVNIKNPKYFDHIEWATEYTEAKYQALLQVLKSLWFQRSWTLEEVMMSTRILIVGRNTHFWSLANFRQGDKRKENDLLANAMLGFKERRAKSANQVLCRAHFRTSTKEHDKVYALANIFDDMVSIDIDYASDASTVMNRFYRQLAERDPSIICFGSNLSPSGKPQSATTMSSYNLPSWTGVAGLHSYRPIIDITLDQNCGFTIDDNMQLHIRCRSYTIRPTEYQDFKVFLNNAYVNDKRAKKANEHYYKMIASIDDFNGDESEALDWSQWCMHRATGCYPTHYYKPNDHFPFISPILPLSLTEECDECIILGVIFDSLIRVTIDYVFAGYDHDYLSPVVKKAPDGFSYRIIGMVLLKRYQFSEHRSNPQDIMDKMLNNCGCETRDFYIK